ncbi:MAG: TonB-dependent receptor [Nitritalea sp.]
MNRYVFLFLSLFGGWGVSGVAWAAVTDTLELQAVSVQAIPVTKYAYGQAVHTVDAEALRRHPGESLGDYLQQKTGLFVRQYGAGMLQTVSTRGTSAGHHAVFWNGLPLNSPSLGQIDFSLLPLAGFDAAHVFMGSAGANFGTDAIGGSTHLETQADFTPGHQVQLDHGLGSFGLWNKSLRYRFAAGSYAQSTTLYRQFTRNDFPFRNLARRETPVERMPHGRVEQLGLVHQSSYTLSDRDQLSMALWWNSAEREIQPVIGSNTRDVQLDNSLRVVVDYFRYAAAGTLNLKAGIVHDENIFNASQNRTRQHLAAGEWDWKGNEWIAAKSGIRYTRAIGRLSTYEAEEDRLELYQSFNVTPSPRLGFSVNLRQFWFDGEAAPFTPSLGWNWQFWQGEIHKLRLVGTAARSFKVPTLNDRFWEPGGNRDLLPEESWSLETGFEHRMESKRWKVEQRLTAYAMWVDNWIVWLPTGNFWSPSNIREVHNRGLEYQGELQVQLTARQHFGLRATYNHTVATNVGAVRENDRTVGNQLPYTPFDKWNAQLTYRIGPLEVGVNQQFVGDRFISLDNSTRVAAYRLTDLHAAYTWRWRGYGGQVQGRVLNAFNTEYQVLRLRAMPGRNYTIHFTVNL